MRAGCSGSAPARWLFGCASSCLLRGGALGFAARDAVVDRERVVRRRHGVAALAALGVRCELLSGDW